jgi:hypothetical protein
MPVFLFVLAILGWLGWKTWRFVQNSQSPRERAIAMRGAMALWFLGFLFLGGIALPIPMIFKVLMIIPAFLVGGTIAKSFRDTRSRLRDEESGRANIEKMKRIN